MKDDSLLTRSMLKRSNTALYRQLYERIRSSILSGKFAPGMRLPSARSLSDRLGVARGTVEMAYQLLVSEGYTESRGAGGTIIAKISRGDLRRKLRLQKTRPAPSGSSIPLHPAKELALFQMGVPAVDAFPRKLWARCVTRAARGLTPSDLRMQEALGIERLRHALVGYLQISRGIECTVDQVFITAGYQGAIGLISHALMAPRDRIWIEDPGYFFAQQAFERLNANLIHVPVDEEGLDVEAGKRLGPKAKFALVTPTHHYPTGVTLSMTRRMALLTWAHANGAWIIEDDYDSEFHYQGRPLPALKSLDTVDRVLFVGTFSKVLFPGLRMGYLVVPRQLVAPFAAACRLWHPATSALEQRVVSEFIEQGHFARHIRRMRQLYAQRRSALVEAIRHTCGERLYFELNAGGMHMLGYLRGNVDDTSVAKKAFAQGLALAPFSLAAAKARVRPGLMMGFANVPVTAAESAANRLQQIFLR